MINIRSIYFLLLLFSGSFLYAQSWQNRVSEEGYEPNFYEIQASFYDYWKDRKVERSMGYKPFKRWEWFWESRVNPDGSFPDAGLALQEYKSYLRTHDQSTENLVDNWISLGPNSNTSGYAGTGRINAIGFHPTDMNTFYVGAPAGGIWKTANGGSTWTPLLDDWSSIGVSAIVVNPNSPNTIYIATGDGDASDTYSTGVLKSTDGGATWATTGLNWATSNGRVIRKMVMDPNNSNTLMVASSIGIYRTTDAGASWTQVSAGNHYDIAAKPDGTANTFYAVRRSGSTCYIDRSTNDGATWTNTWSVASCNRAALAVSANNPNYVYVMCSNSTGSTFLGFYRSTDSGLTFSLRSSTPNILGYSSTGSDNSGQGWYDLVAAADPLNAEIVYIGGVNNWRTSDGGTTWQLRSHWSGASGVQTVHADKHALFWQNNTTLFEGNDGGVYKTSNGGNTWTDVTNGLVISQMYRVGVSQTDTKVIAGLQDNGTKLRSNAGTWVDEIGGDGMDCAINPTNSNVMYGCIQNGEMRRSTNGGTSWTDIQNNIPGQPDGAWVTPYVLDPLTPTTIYAGYQDLWKSTDQGNTWTSLFTPSPTTTLRHVVVAPSDPNYIYTGTTGTFWKTTDGGVNWSSMNLPSSNITFMVVHPSDPNTLYATRGGFTSGGKVYKTTNGGSTWTNISGTLPNIPANCIVFQNSTNEGLYVGMDVGVYYKDATMSDWSLYNTSLPNVPVSELEINYSTDKIIAGTYGRGLWESDVFAVNSEFINLSSNSISVPYSAATENISVTSNVSWTATSDVPWITVSPSSGTGNGTITLTIAVNPDCVSRNGNVEVTNGTITASLAVEQAGNSSTTVVAPWSEHFNTTTIPGCWFNLGNEPWLFTTAWPAYGAAGLTDHTGNGGSFAGVDGSSPNANDALLETPNIDISGLTSPTLRFYLFSNNTNNAGDNATLSVDIFDGTNWVNEITYAADNPDWVVQTIDLSSYSSPVKARFSVDHSSMTGNQYWNDIVIDDVEVLDFCSGTPAGGTAIGPSVAPCVNADFSLSLAGQTTALGIGYQWQNSPNGTSWSNITGATSQALTTNISTPTYFRAEVTCTSSGQIAYSSSTLVNLNTDACACGCESGATSTFDTKIDSIFIGSATFGTSQTVCETYTDNGASGLTFVPGETVPVSVVTGSCSGNYYTARLAVYADWNNDNDFDDTDEQIFVSAALGAVNVTSTFNLTVPAGQPNSSVKMRYVLQETSSVPVGCGTFTYGETEDLCFDVEEPSNCTPDAVTGMGAFMYEPTSANVYWDRDSTMGFFKLLYRIKGASAWEPIVNVPNTPFNRINTELRNLMVDTVYQYRIRKQCPDLNAGPYSSIQEFSTAAGTVCQNATDGHIGYTKFPDKVRWYSAIQPDAEKYQIGYRLLGTTTEIRKVTRNGRTTISGLTPNSTYEVRWRSLCPSGWTGWTPRTTFVTLPTAPPAPVAASPIALREDNFFLAGEAVIVYPNPVDAMLYLEFGETLPQYVRVFDVYGKLVHERTPQSKVEELYFDAFAKGTYFVQIHGHDGQIHTEKVTKL